MKNDYTIKQIRLYGLSKILIDQVGRNSTSIINDIISESIKKRGLIDILNKYFLPEQVDSIVDELESLLNVKKTLKSESSEKKECKKSDQEVITKLEIGAKGFNI